MVASGSVVRWNDCSMYARGEDPSRPNAFESKVGRFTIRIERHRCWPGSWVVSFKGDFCGIFEQYCVIPSDDPAIAQSDSLTILKRLLQGGIELVQSSQCQHANTRTIDDEILGNHIRCDDCKSVVG